MSHKGFKRTFLKEVSVNITFAETPLLSNNGKFKTFFKETFGISEDFKDMPKFGGVNVVSDNKAEKYSFSTNSASVTIDSSIYRCYEESLKPRIEKLTSFLEALGIDSIDSFIISKQNFFPAKAKNAYTVWKKALCEAFKEDKIKDLSKTADFNEPFKVTIEGTAEYDWGKVRVPFVVDVPDGNNFNFQLDIVALSNPTQTKHLLSSSKILNEAIFDAFTSIISDELIQLMKQA